MIGHGPLSMIGHGPFSAACLTALGLSIEKPAAVCKHTHLLLVYVSEVWGRDDALEYSDVWEFLVTGFGNGKLAGGSWTRCHVSGGDGLGGRQAWILVRLGWMRSEGCDGGEGTGDLGEVEEGVSMASVIQDAASGDAKAALEGLVVSDDVDG